MTPRPSWLVLTIALLLVLPGCGAAQRVPLPPSPDAGPAAPSWTSAFPPELVGTWLGGAQGGSGTLEFTPDGRFSTGRYTGTATVSGATITMQLDGGGAPMTSAWSLQGGVLGIGASTYLRDDRGTSAVPPLVGLWININGWTSIRFDGDGSFVFEDQANGRTSSGTYALDGPQLTLSSPSAPTVTYLVSVDDFLVFSDTSGTVLGEYTRAG